jgi:hypothetical protein
MKQWRQMEQMERMFWALVMLRLWHYPSCRDY